MHQYPLKFKPSELLFNNDLVVQDSDKNDLFFRPKIKDSMVKGEEPCIIFADKVSLQPLYHIQIMDRENLRDYVIKTPGDILLGRIINDKSHYWQVLDESDQVLAVIQEKAAWKNSCLFQLLLLPFDTTPEVVLKLIAPHRFHILINEKKVLTLRQTDSTINEDYKLKKEGEFSEREEALFLAGLIMLLNE